jgi:hypothetical protein
MNVDEPTKIPTYHIRSREHLNSVKLKDILFRRCLSIRDRIPMGGNEQDTATQ